LVAWVLFLWWLPRPLFLCALVVLYLCAAAAALLLLLVLLRLLLLLQLAFQVSDSSVRLGCELVRSPDCLIVLLLLLSLLSFHLLQPVRGLLRRLQCGLHGHQVCFSDY